MTPPLSEHPAPANCMVLEIPADAVSLEPEELYRALGYPATEPPVGMEGLIRATAEDIYGLCDFQGGYVLQSLKLDASQPDGLLLGSRFFRTGKIIRSQLQGAERAALMVCTIGSGPEQRAAQLMQQGEPALGFIADTAASLLAEQVAEAVHRHLEQKLAAEGLGTTNRFSPGYCGWDVREQYDLFRFLPEGFCGVHLHESAFMQPRKSISAIIGIGEGLRRTGYPCVKCDDDQCLYGENKRKPEGRIEP